jgi:hypothetical protein
MAKPPIEETAHLLALFVRAIGAKKTKASFNFGEESEEWTVEDNGYSVECETQVSNGRGGTCPMTFVFSV